MKRLAVFVGLHLIGVVAVILVVTGAARPQTPMEAHPVPPLTAQVPQSGQQPVPIVPPPPAIQSRCEAASLAWLVGKPRTAIPVPVDLSNRRVSCTTCPVTQDYQPDRTDILFDAQTGLITAVKCG